MQTSNVLDGYIDRERIAADFGVSIRTINRWMTQPDGLPFTQIGKRPLFKVESVRKWIEHRERHPNQRREGRHARGA